MNQEKIGKFITECRKSKDLTQKELANLLGVSDKSISKWERGICMPDLSLFTPLCEILDISINDLMSGEKVDDKEYINTLEENIINMVSDLKRKKSIKIKIITTIFIIICLLFILFYIFYQTYEIKVKYDERMMKCNINNNELIFKIEGQSVLNTKHTTRTIEGKTYYFFNTTVNLYNKKRSNWEYSQSLARLLENKKIQFGYIETIDITNEIIVYYTNENLKTIDKLTTTELNKVINESYLMCQS